MAFDSTKPARANPILTDVDQIRDDLNALRNIEASATEPSNLVAHMLWMYTPASGNYVMRQRNIDNDGWNTLWEIHPGSGLIVINSMPLKYQIEPANTGASPSVDELNRIFRIDSSEDRIVRLPSVEATDIGSWIKVTKLGTGKVTIYAADSDTIADSVAGGSIYNEIADDLFTTITLVLITETKYVVDGPYGGWEIGGSMS